MARKIKVVRFTKSLHGSVQCTSFHTELFPYKNIHVVFLEEKCRRMAIALNNKRD